MTVPSVFVSYSHKDEKWKDRLLPHLRMFEQEGRLTIWEDRRIDAGSTWYEELKKAMGDAEVAICLISANYLSSSFCVKEEIPYFLKRRTDSGLLLLPILIDECLWEEIDWLRSIQMLPRDGKTIATHFRSNWNTPFKQVAKEIIAFSKKEARVLATPVSRWSPPEKVDVDRLPVTGAELFGRQNELKILDDAWTSAKINVISFVAWGGVGKSTLINKWREQMAADNYRGAQKVFAWSFYSQGTGDRVTSADLFIAEALKWFGDPEMANSNASPWDKGQRLADLVRSQKTLLLLDGMEPLQSYFDFERGKIKDPALAVLITELAKENPGLCAITTRENVVDLADYPETTQQIDLEQISAEAARALLRVGGVQGTDAELEQAARDFDLHALALNLLAAYIHEIPGHHISNAKDIPDIDVLVNEGKHPRRVMAAFEKRFGDFAEVELLRILGLFSSPAEREEIGAVREAPAIPHLSEHVQVLSDAEWLQLINKLRRLRLIAPESKHRPDALDAHPLVREHFGKQLKQKYPDAWCEGNNRLYEYYKNAAKEYPETIEEMAPLYAAVIHGCQAGNHQEVLDKVYYERIRRKHEAFNLKKLGAIGADLAALSSFFAVPWNTPINTLREDAKDFVSGAAGFVLRAFGRVVDAIEPMQMDLQGLIMREDWRNAVIASGNLSQQYLIIGDISEAINYARQSIDFSNRIDDYEYQIIGRTSLAYALHESGNTREAEKLFDIAEGLQKQILPDAPFLVVYLSGFYYCDLLLDKKDYDDVQHRSSQGLEMSQRIRDLLSIALDNLSLGRALLQARIFSERVAPVQNPLPHLNRALEGLRKAGSQDEIPRGLLARAEYYRIIGDLKKAEKDLDEAFTIATRGGMGLHLADCHLEYARLYLAKSEKGKAGEHWQIAKDSIEKMGYHRRDKEVQELEEQLK